jgi:sirohydrochlorin ferrochelatase
MQHLAQLVTCELNHDGEGLVGVATLEFHPQPLHQQIVQFAQNALVKMCDRLKIIPLFLSAGVHLQTDIPSEIELAQQILQQKIAIDLKPFLGSHPNFAKLFFGEVINMKADGLILLAHGSRRPGSLTSIAAVATQLGAIVAYWSVDPQLKSRVEEFMETGIQRIGILPYFLFAGSITDAIAVKVEEIKLEFPHLRCTLAQPLGVSQELAELIGDLAVTGNKELGGKTFFG